MNCESLKQINQSDTKGKNINSFNLDNLFTCFIYFNITSQITNLNYLITRKYSMETAHCDYTHSSDSSISPSEMDEYKFIFDANKLGRLID